MAGAVQDRGTFRGIARTLLALALLAERAAARSLPVRFVVLAVLFRAEAIARRFVARTAATLIAEAIDAGCPDISFPDLSCLEEQDCLHFGAADAVLLALRLRVLAAVLGMFADADDSLDDQSAGCSDNGSAGWPAIRSVCAAAPLPPLLILVRFPPARRLLRPPDTS